MIVVGLSAGGVDLLYRLLPALPAEFPAPIAICLHASAGTTTELVRHLQSRCRIAVREAEEKIEPAAGEVYFAPGGYHLLVERNRQFGLSLDAPVNFARPSIDVLFESAADCHANRLLGLVLTGASADGAAGALSVRRRGGHLIVQSPETAYAPVLPEAALRLAGADSVLSPEALVPELLRLLPILPPPGDPHPT
jgi:two-component system chemotaxis response regulator CheB